MQKKYGLLYRKYVSVYLKVLKMLLKTPKLRQIEHCKSNLSQIFWRNESSLKGERVSKSQRPLNCTILLASQTFHRIHQCSSDTLHTDRQYRQDQRCKPDQYENIPFNCYVVFKTRQVVHHKTAPKRALAIS